MHDLKRRKGERARNLLTHRKIDKDCRDVAFEHPIESHSGTVMNPVQEGRHGPTEVVLLEGI